MIGSCLLRLYSDKAAGCVSDLVNELDSLPCQFRHIEGDGEQIIEVSINISAADTKAYQQCALDFTDIVDDRARRHGFGISEMYIHLPIKAPRRSGKQSRAVNSIRVPGLSDI